MIEEENSQYHHHHYHVWCFRVWFIYGIV
jgi:SAUR family protein